MSFRGYKIKETKGNILNAGAKLVWQQGFNNTDLQKI